MRSRAPRVSASASVTIEKKFAIEAKEESVFRSCFVSYDSGVGWDTETVCPGELPRDEPVCSVDVIGARYSA